MDLFKIANQLAKNMSENEKDQIEGMDMEKMISHVTQNVFKMMNVNGPGTGPEESSADIADLMGNMMNTLSFKQPVVENFQKTRDICFELNVDLEDFYNGKKKKLNVKRKRVIQEPGGKQKIIEEKKKIIIPIEPGMRDEQQLRFPGEADQIPGFTPGDIVITLIENQHPVFQRENDNLFVIKNINPYELYDITFDIKHLDGRTLRITKQPYDALHLNESIRKIPFEGMPVYKKATHGDLFVRFNLVIPKSIDKDKLYLFKQIFKSENDILEESFSKSYVLENVSEADLEELDYSGSDSESDSSEISSDSELSLPTSVEEIFPKKRLPNKR